MQLHVEQFDRSIVEKARQLIAGKRKMRWSMLFYALAFLGICVYFAVALLGKIEALDGQVGMGFVYGFAMAVAWMFFGIIGAFCLGKFASGFEKDFRLQELLVGYHDRLCELGQLPEQKQGASADRERRGG